MGFETVAIQADMSLFDMTDIPYPFIVHVNKEGKLQHYYVVYKNLKDRVLIGDPDPTVKVTKMSKERFASEWTGVVIFLAPEPSYKPHKDKKNGLLDFLSPHLPTTNTYLLYRSSQLTHRPHQHCWLLLSARDFR